MKRSGVVIGSRWSPLALWQANFVKAELLKFNPSLAITTEVIRTTGDAIIDSPLSKIGDKGLFTKEIERALIERQVDIAVHSLKDLPTILPRGLMIGAVTKREDVHDVFIAPAGKPYRSLEDVPKGGTVATGSLRRSCQLLNWRPDLIVADVRGNLNTRLDKLDGSDWDGMILARAGVVRLGAEDRITESLPIDRMLPAVGQGALGIEIRQGDTVAELVSPLNSEATMISTNGERALLRALEGGCQVPIGAYGRIDQNEFVLDAMIGSLDGKRVIRGRIHGPLEQAEALAEQLARTLLESGGREVLAEVRNDRGEEVSPDR